MKDERKTKKQLIDELLDLRQRVRQLEVSGSRMKDTGEALRRRTNELNERIKELNCLFGISALTEKPGISLEGILQGTVNLIPLAWQHPERTSARITLKGQEFRTGDFRETGRKLASDITVRGERIGSLEVRYLEERPERDEGCFANEERSLLNAIAERLARIIERKQAEGKIKHLNLLLRAILGVNQLITREKDSRRLLKGVCNTLKETRGYYNTWTALLDESGRLLATAQAGLGEDFTPMAERLKHGKLTDCGQKALRQSNVVITEDPVSTCGDCPLAVNYSGRGAMTIRLEYSGKVYGLLSVSIPRDFIAEKEEQTLFEEVATDIAYALHSLELEEEQKRIQKALKESEESSSSLLKNAPHAIIVINPDSSIRYVNPALERLTGFSAAELSGRKPPYPWWTEATPEQTSPHFLEALYARAQRREELFQKKNGERFWVEITSAPVRTDGELRYYLSNWADITERKRGLEALEDSERQLRFLSSELLKAQENERRRIAQELHDGIGQTLSAIKFGLEDALEALGPNIARSGSKTLESIIPLVKAGIEDIRRICSALRPSTLDDLGLLATISWFCREFQAIYSGIQVEKQIDIEENEVPDILKTVIYRVLQEAFNNIAKHSKANLVRLYLKKAGGAIELFIEDNGRGFHLQDALSADIFKKGLGLASMKERTEHSGGSFSIESVRGSGTIVRASWPGMTSIS